METEWCSLSQIGVLNSRTRSPFQAASGVTALGASAVDPILADGNSIKIWHEAQGSSGNSGSIMRWQQIWHGAGAAAVEQEVEGQAATW